MGADTDASQSSQEVLDFVTQFRFLSYSYLALFVILFYDYLTTFDREVRLMWGRRFTWSKTIFLLNRYSAIILGLLLWVEMVLPTGTHQSCVKLEYTLEICGIIRSIASAVFSGTLIYAISYRNAPITSVVVFLGMAPVLARIFLVSRGRFNISIPLPGEEMGCLIVLDLPPRAAMIVDVTSQSARLLFGAIVIVETWRKTWRTVRSALLGNSFQSSLSATILREGTIYFVIIELCTALGIISDALGNTYVSIVASLLSTASPVLISRFYFLMNAVQDRESEGDFPTTPPWLNTREPRKTSLRFAHESSSLQSRGNLEVRIHQETHLA